MPLSQSLTARCAHLRSEPFRELLVHKRIKPILEEILGVGYRMDHSPDLMRMEKGGDGQTLHGGAFQRYQAGGFLEGACKRLWKWAEQELSSICCLQGISSTRARSTPGCWSWSSCSLMRARATAEWRSFKAAVRCLPTRMQVPVSR